MITVVGLGEIGEPILVEIAKKLGKENVFGADINDEKLEYFKKQGYLVGKAAPPSDVYIIAVYLTDQVFQTLDQIDCSKKPIVSIESTIAPGTAEKIIEWKKKNKKDFGLVLFPHRFNPNDAEHHVFNLDRVIGAESEEVLNRAISFFSQFMDKKLIHSFPLEIVELTKPVENAYRFMEIAIAEQLKVCCDGKGIDFEKLREAASTKWNIKICEARDGVKGKCLPKDTLLINDFFPENELFKAAFEFNEKYKAKYGKK